MNKVSNFDDAIFAACDISSVEADQIRSKIAENNASLWLRARWLGHLSDTHLFSSEHIEQCLWWVEHYPASKICRYHAEIFIDCECSADVLKRYVKLWDYALSTWPRDRNLVEAAAEAIGKFSPERSIALYQGLLERFPKKSEYFRRTAELVAQLAQENVGPLKEAYAERALSLIETAFANSAPEQWSSLLFGAAQEIAFIAERPDKLEFFAQSALTQELQSWEKEHERFVDAHTSLGFAALMQNKPQVAAVELEKITTRISEYDGYFQECDPCRLAELLQYASTAIVLRFVEAVPSKYLRFPKDKTLASLKLAKHVQIWEGQSTSNAMVRRAVFLKKIGNEKEAKDTLLRADDLEHKSYVSSYSLGRCLYQAQEAERSIRNLLDALENPDYLDDAKESRLIDKLSPEVRRGVEHLFK